MVLDVQGYTTTYKTPTKGRPSEGHKIQILNVFKKNLVLFGLKCPSDGRIQLHRHQTLPEEATSLSSAWAQTLRLFLQRDHGQNYKDGDQDLFFNTENASCISAVWWLVPTRHTLNKRQDYFKKQCSVVMGRTSNT